MGARVGGCGAVACVGLMCVGSVWLGVCACAVVWVCVYGCAIRDCVSFRGYAYISFFLMIRTYIHTAKSHHNEAVVYISSFRKSFVYLDFSQVWVLFCSSPPPKLSTDRLTPVLGLYVLCVIKMYEKWTHDVLPYIMSQFSQGAWDLPKYRNDESLSAYQLYRAQLYAVAPTPITPVAIFVRPPLPITPVTMVSYDSSPPQCRVVVDLGSPVWPWDFSDVFAHVIIRGDNATSS